MICQAGGSAAGKAFAARHADTIIARARNAADAKAYRDDVSRRMTAHGRDPRDCKVMFATSIVLGETVREAQEKKARQHAALVANMEPRLAQLSFLSGIDFAKFDLDAPLPEVKTNASQAMTALFTTATGKQTLREMLVDPGSGGIDFVGTPDSVAAKWARSCRRSGAMGF